MNLNGFCKNQNVLEVETAIVKVLVPSILLREVDLMRKITLMNVPWP